MSITTPVLENKYIYRSTYLLEILVVIRNLQEISEKKTTILSIKIIKIRPESFKYYVMITENKDKSCP